MAIADVITRSFLTSYKDGSLRLVADPAIDVTEIFRDEEKTIRIDEYEGDIDIRNKYYTFKINDYQLFYELILKLYRDFYERSPLTDFSVVVNYGRKYQYISLDFGLEFEYEFNRVRQRVHHAFQEGEFDRVASLAVNGYCSVHIYNCKTLEYLSINGYGSVLDIAISPQSPLVAELDAMPVKPIVNERFPPA